GGVPEVRAGGVRLATAGVDVQVDPQVAVGRQTPDLQLRGGLLTVGLDRDLGTRAFGHQIPVVDDRAAALGVLLERPSPGEPDLRGDRRRARGRGSGGGGRRGLVGRRGLLAGAADVADAEQGEREYLETAHPVLSFRSSGTARPLYSVTTPSLWVTLAIALISPLGLVGFRSSSPER